MSGAESLSPRSEQTTRQGREPPSPFLSKLRAGRNAWKLTSMSLGCEPSMPYDWSES
jgi:hypothetical protein